MSGSQQAEPLSLRDLIVTHQSKKFWCDPDLWTEELLEFLQCKVHSLSNEHYRLAFNCDFRHGKGPIWQSCETNYRERRRDEDIRELFQELILEVEGKIEPDIEFCSQVSIPIYFGGKVVTEVLVHIDPYLVAVMIAMAQNPPLNEGEARSGPTIVQLVTPNMPRNAFTWYSAAISAEFLSKFDQPYKHFDAPLDITEQTIPFTFDGIFNLIDEPGWLAKEKVKPKPDDLELDDKEKDGEQGEDKLDEDVARLASLIARVTAPIRPL
ncbi:hypothetical protein B7463_g372, partial [Scytalidium lignicola]